MLVGFYVTPAVLKLLISARIVDVVGVSGLTGHMLACNPQINPVWSFFF